MKRLIERVAAFFSELKRRKVYRVVILYGIGAYAVIELSDIVLPVLGAPEGSMALVLALVVGAFPVALLLGWTYDVTRGRIERDPADRQHTPRRSLANRLALLAGALAMSLLMGWAAWSIWRTRQPAPGPEIAATGSAIPEGDPRRIAVLYFDDHSEDQSLGYLAAGLTESLIHELSNVRGLMVSSRNAVKPFRHGDRAADSIISALGAGSLVEGSVTEDGGTVRATVQLIDGATRGHLSSQVVEGSADSVFAFQDALADSVARALRRHLGREIRLRGARAGTDSQQAWTLYQRGSDLLATADRRRRELGTESQASALFQADSLLARAVAADPDWAEPRVARVRVSTQLAAIHGPRPAALDTTWARLAIRRADEVLRDYPRNAEAYELRGWTRLRLFTTYGPTADSLLEPAREDLDTAIEIDPERASAWWKLSETLGRQDRHAEALDAADKALKRDVFLDVESSAAFQLFHSSLQLGPLPEAVRWCDSGYRRFPGQLNFIRCQLLILGSFPQVPPDVARAWELFEELMASAPDRNREIWRMVGGLHVAQVLARAGLADSARAVLRAARGDGDLPPYLAVHEAKVHLLLGAPEDAVRLLRSYLTFDPDTAYVAQDWWFDELHDHPGFREMVGLTTGPG